MLYLLFLLFPISKSYQRSSEIDGNEIDSDLKIDKEDNILKHYAERNDPQENQTQETSTTSEAVRNTSSIDRILPKISNNETADDKVIYSSKIHDKSTTDPTNTDETEWDETDQQDSDFLGLFDIIGDTVISSLKFIWYKFLIVEFILNIHYYCPFSTKNILFNVLKVGSIL